MDKHETIAPSVFLDLILSLSGETEESVIISKSLSVYMRKLNCFMVGIFESQNEYYIQKGILPGNLLEHHDILKMVHEVSLSRRPKTEVQTYPSEESNYYLYPLKDYGLLVLGRKKPFSIQLVNELKPIVDNLGKSLSLAKNIGLREAAELQTSSLLEHLNLLKNFIQRTTDALQVADTSGKIVFLNKEACDRLGIDSNLLNHHHVWDFEPLFRKEGAWDQHVKELKELGKITIESTNFNLLTNRVIPVEVTVTYTEIGGTDYIIAISRDISERKATNNELIRRERMLLAISSATNTLLSGTDVFESISSSLQVIGEAVQVDRTYLFTNSEDPELGILTSQRSEWNSGSADPQIDNPELQNLPIEMFQDFLEVIEGGSPYVKLIRDMDPDSQLREILEMQAIISIVIIPIFHMDKFWGFVGFDDCQKERNWTEAEISILQTYVSAIQNALDRDEKISTIKSMALFPLQNPDPVIRIDTLGNIILQNKAAEAINLLEFQDEILSKEQFFIYLIQNVNAEKIKLNLQIKEPSGKYFSVSCRFIEELDQINIYFSDITQQKITEYELRQAKIKAEESDKAKEEFIANISHEIRTPLHAIISLSHQLLKTNQTNENLKFLTHITQSGNHLQSLINNILDFSKIAAGEFELHYSTFSIKQLIFQIKSIINALAQEKNLATHFQISPDVSEFLIGDETRLRQILLNLLSNAVKFTYEGGVEVDISVTHAESLKQHIQIKIKDSGVGMSQEFLHKLFHKFSQEDPTSQRKFGGTGLGMAITRELIQLMNGEIQVYSNKGAGTTFIVTIPFEKPDNMSLDVNDFSTNMQMLSDKLVLLVEDNPINRLVVNTQLAQYGIEIIDAENGLFAIEHPRLNDVDVILMDLQMPEMDGFAATTYIRNTLGLQTPIIALTANAIKTEIERCFEVGMNDYVLKPFNESQLINSIINQLELSPSNNQLMEPIESNDSALYDLSSLRQLAANSPEFLHSIINMFLDQIPREIDEMEQLWKQKDYEAVKKIAHRIKPNFIQFGIHCLQSDLQKVNYFDYTNAEELDSAELALQNITQTIPKVIQQLQLEVSVKPS
jgi:PAS domain S-box-containing protein